MNTRQRRGVNMDRETKSGNGSDMARAADPTATEPREATRTGGLQTVGCPKKRLPYPAILAKKKKKAWLESLKRSGMEELLFEEFALLKNPPTDEYYKGMQSSYWMLNTDVPPATFSSMENALPAQISPGIYIHHSNFLWESAITAISATIGSLIQSSEPCPLTSSAPQLLLSSSLGFSCKYLKDTAPILYRCFLFMAEESVDSDEDKIGKNVQDEDIGHSFVVTGDGETIKNFGDHQVLTMTALFKEAHRKFRLNIGDILVIKGNYRITVDLAMNKTKGRSRMLLWSYLKKEQTSPGFVQLTCPKPINTIEDIINENNDAPQFYVTEMREIESDEKHSKDIGDVSGYMERLRFTPGHYSKQDIVTRISGQRGLYDIFEWIEGK